MKTTIKIFEKKSFEQNFIFYEGNAALLDENGKVTAATCGLRHEDKLYIYRTTTEGKWAGYWKGSWEDASTFPIEEVLASMLDYERGKSIPAPSTGW